MNKIEEILKQYPFFIEEDYDILSEVMKEYAEYYCNKYKQSLIDGCFNHNGVQMTEKQDIIETKLPEHE